MVKEESTIEENPSAKPAPPGEIDLVLAEADREIQRRERNEKRALKKAFPDGKPPVEIFRLDCDPQGRALFMGRGGEMFKRIGGHFSKLTLAESVQVFWEFWTHEDAPKGSTHCHEFGAWLKLVAKAMQKRGAK